MNNVRYTFLHFLSDNLAAPVHQLRRDTADPSADALAMNSVNVTFLNIDIGGAVSQWQVVIDVINDDETTVVDWVQSVGDLLNMTHFTPLLDYTDPATPVPAGGNVWWGETRFMRVASEFYCHFTCTLYLQAHN